MNKKFDDMAIGDEFAFKGRQWKKRTDHGAECLDRNAPFDAGTIIAIYRNSSVVPKIQKNKFDLNSIFKQKE